MTQRSDLSQLLLAWQQGEISARDAITPALYAELRRLASRAMAAERPGHLLQTTALLHEAFERLLDVEVDLQGRQHFFALAARVMRRVLVDHARSVGRQKRGGDVQHVDITIAAHVADAGLNSFVELDEALTRLEQRDPRMAQAVELVYFGGLSYEEAAAHLGISRSVLAEDLMFAKAWLRTAMS